MIGFKLDLFDLIEGIRDGVFYFVGNFLWSTIVLLRHPVRGPRYLAARFVASKHAQMGPFTFVTTFVFLGLLVIASIGQFPVDDELTTVSGQPVSISLSNYLDLLSTPNAVVLLLASALFATLLQSFQRIFFQHLESFISKTKLELIISSLGFSSLYAAVLGFLALCVLAPIAFFGLLFSGSIEFLGAGESNQATMGLVIGLVLVASVVIGALPSAQMMRQIIYHGQKVGAIAAAPLSRPTTVFRCTAPYIFAYLAVGTAAYVSLPDQPKIWISHVKCEPQTKTLSAKFAISNQTSVDVLVPRDYFELEFTPDYDGVGGAAGAGLVSVIFNVSHNVKGVAFFTIEGAKLDQTAIFIGKGETYHGTLELQLDDTQVSDLTRLRGHRRGTVCRIHAPGRPHNQMISTSQFEYLVDPPVDQLKNDEQIGSDP